MDYFRSIILVLKNYRSKLNIYGLEAFWVGVGQLLAALGGLVGVRILTNVLTPAIYGELALGVTFATLINQILFGPIAAAVLRFYSPSKEVRQFKSYLKDSIKISFIATIITIVLGGLALLAAALSGYFHFAWFIIFTTTFAILSGVNAILNGLQNAARQRKVVAWHQGLSQWLRFLIAAALISILSLKTSWLAMGGYSIAIFITVVSQLIIFNFTIRRTVLSKEATEAVKTNWGRDIYIYALPFVSWGIFTWLSMSSDRWALALVGGTSLVGLYAVLYQLGYYPIQFFSTFISQLISPVLFDRAGDGSDPKRLQKAWEMNNTFIIVALVATLSAFFIAFFVHKWVFYLFVASGYQSVSYLLPYIVLSSGFFAVGQIASLNILSGKRSGRLLPPKIGAAVLGIIFNFGFAYFWKIEGVIIGGLIVNLVFAIWVYLLGKKYMKESISSMEPLLAELQ